MSGGQLQEPLPHPFVKVWGLPIQPILFHLFLATPPEADRDGKVEQERQVWRQPGGREPVEVAQDIQVQPPPVALIGQGGVRRSEEHTSELQSRFDLVCRLLLEKKKRK